MEDSPFAFNETPEFWREMFLAERRCGDHLCLVQKFIYTCALIVDPTFEGDIFYDYKARYCYENPADTVIALLTWDGEGDPPGPWVKEKVSERLGPGVLAA